MSGQHSFQATSDQSDIPGGASRVIQYVLIKQLLDSGLRRNDE